MSIKIVKGDAVKALKEGEINYLLHCVNCQGVMGSGIALQIRHAFPEVYEDYIEFIKHKNNLQEKILGECRVSRIQKDINVVNLFGQENFGTQVRQLNYGAISQSLWLFKNHYDFCNEFKDNRLSIGLPYKMGCDRAGGDWEIVYEMVEFYLQDYDVMIYKL